MRLSVMVTGAPYSTQASTSAYQFCRAALGRGHEVRRVFFYQDGVHNGTRLAVPPQDETDIIADWVSLATDSSMELVVCVASSQRRGVLGGEQAAQAEIDGDNLHPAFTVAGLGLMLESVIESDRFISFGP